MYSLLTYQMLLSILLQTAVTHKKHDEKEDPRTVAFTWTAPAGFNDDIKFR